MGAPGGFKAMGGWRFGNTIDGCQAEYVLVPDAMTNLAPIPEGLSDEEVLMCPDIMSTGFGGAEKAGIKPGPLKKLTLAKRPDLPNNQDDSKDSAITVNFDEANSNNCAYAFWLVQRLPQRKVLLTISEEGKQSEVDVTPQVDPEWTLPIIGLQLEAERLTQKAESFEEAVWMSIARTKSSALDIYLTLRSLVTGRVSYKELHGPLGIAGAAYQVAQQGWIAMLLFLGFLSVNLAVLNFLPIPVLDGGHMVFLTWEAITRRRPSERVMIGATYVGFAFLLGLMALVLYLDLFVHPFAKK